MSVGRVGGVDGVDEGDWSRESESEFGRMSEIGVDSSACSYKVSMHITYCMVKCIISLNIQV